MKWHRLLFIVFYLCNIIVKLRTTRFGASFLWTFILSSALNMCDYVKFPLQTTGHSICSKVWYVSEPCICLMQAYFFFKYIYDFIATKSWMTYNSIRWTTSSGWLIADLTIMAVDQGFDLQPINTVLTCLPDRWSPTHVIGSVSQKKWIGTIHESLCHVQTQCSERDTYFWICQQRWQRLATTYVVLGILQLQFWFFYK